MYVNIYLYVYKYLGLPRWLSGKKSTCQCRRHKTCGFDPWVGKIPCSMATHSNILAWRISHTENFTGRLQFIGLQRVGHDGTHVRAHVHTHTQRILMYTCIYIYTCIHIQVYIYIYKYLIRLSN